MYIIRKLVALEKATMVKDWPGVREILEGQ
jgi:hypothetical protein